MSVASLSLREKLFDLWKLQFYRDVAIKAYAELHEIPETQVEEMLGIECDDRLRNRWNLIDDHTKRLMGLLSYPENKV